MPTSQNLTPLRRLEVAGSNFRVAKLFFAGATQEEILSNLESAFPGETNRTYQAAYNAGIDAATSGQIFDQNNPDFPLLYGYVPSGLGTSGGFRFLVLASGIDPNTGLQFERYLYPVFDSLPSFDDFHDTITNLLIQMFQPGGYPKNKGINLDTGNVIVVTLGIERAG